MNRVLHPFLWRWNSSVAMDERSAAVIENPLFNLIAKLRSTLVIGLPCDNIVPLALYFPRFEYAIAGGWTIKRANVNTARSVYTSILYNCKYIQEKKRYIWRIPFYDSRSCRWLIKHLSIANYKQIARSKAIDFMGEVSARESALSRLGKKKKTFNTSTRQRVIGSE